MMFVPLVSLLAHLLMKNSGNYQPLLSWHDLDEFRIAKPLIYYGRGIFVAILLAFWLLAIGMFVEAYVQQQDMNFMAWVSDQRLRYCAEQITATNRKINEIAASCGYNDLPNFTRAFKQRFGMSPSKYRKHES